MANMFPSAYSIILSVLGAVTFVFYILALVFLKRFTKKYPELKHIRTGFIFILISVIVMGIVRFIILSSYALYGTKIPDSVGSISLVIQALLFAIGVIYIIISLKIPKESRQTASIKLKKKK